MKKLLTLIILFFALHVSAQIHEPITWKFSHNKLNEQFGEIQIQANIENEWHLYGTELPEGGPSATQITFTELNNAELQGELSAEGELQEYFDENFGMKLNWYSQKVIFKQKITYTNAEDILVKGNVNYMACNNETCIPPTEEEFTIEIKATKKAEKPTESAIVETPKFLPLTPLQPAITAQETDYWTPVINELNSFKSEGSTESNSLWWIFLAGLLGGFVALFTPCVWPIIPMTVSFFLKRSENKARGKRDAVFYGLSIIVIYVLLGIIITLLFGASALNELSTNAFFNLFFFALLVIFAISFLGAFEITLPASWSTKIDSKAENASGILSILLMAFTLVLVSFSCTGPIIGTLLVEVANSGTITAPAIGMLGFAVALALPFSFFAFFPAILKSLPKSGGWLNSVKVVLGFLELALALKFLSVADLAYGWGILDREVFIAIWILIFTLLGLYLLGKIRFAHDSDVKHISVTRTFLAIISLSFAMYMIPGLWGAPLKAISAFTPPLSTQDFNLYDNEVHADFDNFDAGMAYAKQQNKPVIVDFSGYGCVNCRKMEATVWTDMAVAEKLNKDFVLITLYVDDKTPLEKPYTVQENGKTRNIKTLGDKWSYLQRVKFGANAQPFYVMLNNEGFPMNGSYTFDENPENFRNWLNKK